MSKQKEKGSARRGFGRFLIVIGILAIAAGIGLYLYNMWDSNRAGEASDQILDEMQDKISEEEEDDSEDVLDPTSTEMATMEIDGHTYIGWLDVPCYDLELPVMAEWSYDNLRISPCLYSGSYLTGDMVICGHNYARHFSPLKWIDIGEDIYFTTVDGDVYHYTVSNRETVRPTSVEQMIENDKNSSSSSDWDMTLFTCTTGGQTRCAVRCILADD